MAPGVDGLWQVCVETEKVLIKKVQANWSQRCSSLILSPVEQSKRETRSVQGVKCIPRGAGEVCPCVISQRNSPCHTLATRHLMLHLHSSAEM